MDAQFLSAARRELILGGQKSGKSRRAEQCAAAWLAAGAANRAVLIATAEANDREMQSRIARHQRERAARVPGLLGTEEPLALGAAIRACSTPQTMVLVDCLTLWLTNRRMPAAGRPLPADDVALEADFFQALHEAPGPVVLVGNEIGLGVIPMGEEVRGFVDALGCLNQQVALQCERVTLMAAGLPLALKDVRP